MEKDLEKSCDCCEDCNCGDECHCTPDNKCCDECTCDTNCKCHNQECDCEEDCNCDTKCDCDANDVDGLAKDCECDEHCDCTKDSKCCDECDCGGSKCDCTDDCKCSDSCECNEEDKCSGGCECNDNRAEDSDKCQCGCGETLGEGKHDEYFKQLLSLQAEFDNYRKRTQNDIANAYRNGFNQAITEFLPALDSFKMATEYITDPNTLMGIQYIEKGILNTLEKIGVKAIDVSGKFDPNFHQAIGSEVSCDHESGDIIKECFKGFIMGDKVIRYAQVIVAK